MQRRRIKTSGESSAARLNCEIISARKSCYAVKKNYNILFIFDKALGTLNNHFSSLKNEVEDNRKEANAGTASAIAIASQPQVKTGDVMMVSAGAGTFNGESAVSVGTSFNAGTHTVLKAGISADTQSDFGAGVGVGYSF